jgi:predicted O-methyltransferase YrrM
LYSSAQLAVKYLSYYLGAHNGKGHGVHSPFVFDFITRVLNDRKQYPCYDQLEAYRRRLLKDDRMISVQDYGAGSAMIKQTERKVGAIASTSLKPVKYARLLHRMVRYYQPSVIVELGTSFGISTSYMAKGNPSARVYTLEGAPSIASIALQQFRDTDIGNVQLAEGEFAAVLPGILHEIPPVDFAFIDGNHQYGPTLDYFSKLLARSHQRTIMVFDDIHWSRGMEDAWNRIKDDPAVTLSIDLFFIGIVFFDKSFLVKQHFPIRF